MRWQHGLDARPTTKWSCPSMNSASCQPAAGTPGQRRWHVVEACGADDGPARFHRISSPSTVTASWLFAHTDGLERMMAKKAKKAAKKATKKKAAKKTKKKGVGFF